MDVPIAFFHDFKEEVYVQKSKEVQISPKENTICQLKYYDFPTKKNTMD